MKGYCIIASHGIHSVDRWVKGGRGAEEFLTREGAGGVGEEGVGHGSIV